jgi:hypothetical protein
MVQDPEITLEQPGHSAVAELAKKQLCEQSMAYFLGRDDHHSGFLDEDLVQKAVEADWDWTDQLRNMERNPREVAILGEDLEVETLAALHAARSTQDEAVKMQYAEILAHLRITEVELRYP